MKKYLFLILLIIPFLIAAGGKTERGHLIDDEVRVNDTSPAMSLKDDDDNVTFRIKLNDGRMDFERGSSTSDEFDDYTMAQVILSLSDNDTLITPILTNCDTIDTDSNGLMTCGTDSDTDQVGTLTTGDLCINDGSNVNCTVNLESELETALDSINVIVSTEIDTMAEINALSTDTDAVLDTDIGSTVEAWDATLDDIADGTILENLVNTTNPWADNEVADTLTVDNSSTVDADALACDVGDDDLLSSDCVLNIITDVGNCTSGDCDLQTATFGDGSTGDIVWTFDGDAGTDGTVTWDVSEDLFSLDKFAVTGSLVGGLSTSSDLNIYPHNQGFADTNTGRINVNERIVFPVDTTIVGNPWGFGNAIHDSWITVDGTLTIGSSPPLNIFAWSGFTNAQAINYSTAQLLTAARTFAANVRVEPTAGITDIGATWSGFFSNNYFYPLLSSAVTATTIAVVGYEGDPRMALNPNSNASAAAVLTSLDAFRAFSSSNLIDTVGLNSTATNVRGFVMYNPVKDATGTITNIIGFDTPDITTTATLVAGVRSAITSGSGKWFLYDTGGANSALTGNLRIGDTTAPTQALEVSGIIETTGTTPTIGTCGTSPSITGTNHSGSFTTGSTATTSCVITFGSPSFTNTPSCMVNPRASGVTPRVSAVSTTSFTATYSSGSSRVIDYICMGYQ